MIANTILGVVVGALVLVGLLCVVKATAKHLSKREKPATPEEPAVCLHEWEPWSEPKEVGVKQQKQTWLHYSGTTTTESEFVGKFQDRVCSKCNIYERRWA